jgi:dCTP deaminase
MLNDTQIRKYCQNTSHPLISEFSEKLLQSHSYDLTLGKQFVIYDSKKSHDSFIVGESNIEDFSKQITSEKLCIQPGDFVLGVTQEYLYLPDTITALVEGKSTIGRLGLLIHDAGFVDAGFHGTITLEIKNLNSFPITVVAGMKIAQILFFDVDKPEKAYGFKGNHYQGQIEVKKPDLGNILEF